MSTIVGSGNLPAFSGSATNSLHVAEQITINGAGSVSFFGSGTATIYSGEDKAPYTTHKHPDLAGIKDFCQGPGLLVATAAEDANKVLLVDQTPFRKIRIYAESELLPAPPVAIQSTTDYIFVYCCDRMTAARYLVVLSNSVDLTIVLTEVIERGDLSSWIAVREEAGVFAYPDGRSSVVVRSIHEGFETLSKGVVANVGSATVLAGWFRFRFEERPILDNKIQEKWILYCIHGHGETSIAIEYSLLKESVSETIVSQDIRFIGELVLEGAEAPVRIDRTGRSVVLAAAITPRGSVTPVFEGALQISDGQWLLVWGYNNENPFIVDQPLQNIMPDADETVLTINRLTGITAEQEAELVPTLFMPGMVHGAVVVKSTDPNATWTLQPQGGGGVAPTDITQPIDPAMITSLSAYVVRKDPAALMRYLGVDPLMITRVAREMLEAETLNNAGTQFNSTTPVRHTYEFNTDISGQNRWYEREIAVRIEGGVIQAHGKDGRISRILQEELYPELARGELFDVPNSRVEFFTANFAPDDIAQEGEKMGWEIGHSYDGSIIGCSAEAYEVGVHRNAGRCHLWTKNSDNTATWQDVVESGDLPQPLWELPTGASEDRMYFSRCTAVRPQGDLVFVGAKSGPGIAVMRVTENNKFEYWKTLQWPEYDALPIPFRSHEGRFDETGKIFTISCGWWSASATLAPPGGTMHILYSDDDWETFEVRQVFERPDGDSQTDVFITYDLSRDGSTLAIGAPGRGRAYAFRTDDEWVTKTDYILDSPAGVPEEPHYTPALGYDRKQGFGNSGACSYDGFRIAFGSYDFCYDNGGPNEILGRGGAWMYVYDHETDSYTPPQEIIAPLELVEDSHFGNSVRFNYAGARIVVQANGYPAQFVYGIHDWAIEAIVTILDVIVDSADTRWLWSEDTTISSDRSADNPESGKTEVGSFLLANIPEYP